MGITISAVSKPALANGGNMVRTTTVDVPDDLADRLTEAHELLPELFALSNQLPALPAQPAQLYRTRLTFLASAPTPVQVTAFTLSPELQPMLQLLLERSHARDSTATERAELDEPERTEHVMVMLKTGHSPRSRRRETHLQPE
jgi:hypothetical protein